MFSAHRSVVTVAIVFAGLVPGANSQAAWTLQRTVSPMDNVTTITLHTVSVTATKDRFNHLVSPRLAIRCKLTDVDLIFDADMILQHGEIRIKADQSQAETLRGEESTNHRASFLSNQREWLEKLETTKVLLIEFTPFQEGSRIVRFNTDGLTKHKALIKEHCGEALKF